MNEEKIENTDTDEAQRLANHKKHVICSIICGVVSVIIIIAVVAISTALGLNRGDSSLINQNVELFNYFNIFYN